MPKTGRRARYSVCARSAVCARQLRSCVCVIFIYIYIRMCGTRSFACVRVSAPSALRDAALCWLAAARWLLLVARRHTAVVAVVVIVVAVVTSACVRACVRTRPRSHEACQPVSTYVRKIPCMRVRSSAVVVSPRRQCGAPSVCRRPVSRTINARDTRRPENSKYNFFFFWN